MKLFLGIVLALFLAACGAPSADRQEPPPLVPGRPAAPAAPPPSGPPSTPSAADVAPLIQLPPMPRFDTRVATENRTVPFRSVTREDSSADRGERWVSKQGAVGVRTMIYEVTTINGRELSRRLVTDLVTTPAVDEVTTVGTRAVVSSCDPNYSGCVPIASDVDCAGGRGNGPAYVRGPVTVRGTDIYGLDGDGDGIGCE